MDQADSRTMELLQRWHGGDREALDELIERDLPWIQQHVRRRLGPMLRARGETVDYVQDAMIEVLEYGPKFVSASQSRFRAMIARIVENTLRDQHDWFKAKRRAMSREQPLPSDSVLHIDGRHGEITRPSQNAVKAERESYVRLALELLEPDDRKVIMRANGRRSRFRRSPRNCTSAPIRRGCGSTGLCRGWVARSRSCGPATGSSTMRRHRTGRRLTRVSPSS
jgi:DNA-directed RNA polymerase specialized sigma24 family protein